MNDEYGYVKFLGDYSKLKSMGFTFQKLFAGNYMQWCKDGFRIWKKGSDITHDEYNLFKLIRFLRTNPEMRCWDSNPNGKRGTKTYSFYKFYSDVDNNIYDYYPASEENTKKYSDNMKLWGKDNYDEDNPPPYLGDTVCIGDKQLDFLRELNELGWYELDYYPED
jgi:hypothetical protein